MIFIVNYSILIYFYCCFDGQIKPIVRITCVLKIFFRKYLFSASVDSGQSPRWSVVRQLHSPHPFVPHAQHVVSEPIRTGPSMQGMNIDV